MMLQAPSPDSLEARISRAAERVAGATVAVSIIDPATDSEVSIHGSRSFHAASTMKIPVMIEVFRQASMGRFSLGDSLEVRNSFRSIVDGSQYQIVDDSDDAIYERLGERMSIRDLVYQMITVSSNLATNLLIDFVAADSVQRTIEDLGVREMRVLRGVEDIKAYDLGLNNTATADDLAVLLLRMLKGEAVSAGASAEMVKVLLEQRFNEMIPAGMPEGAKVAHKTGSITRINHDAGIVYPPTGEPYVLVILIEGVEDGEVSSRLGADIARLVHSALRP
jgi:beta-lactamase class A